MREKSWFLFLAVIFLLHSATVVFAGNLLGPKKYTRTKAKPDVYTEKFSATSQTGFLRILNGSEEGKNRVTSASIYLNDAPLLDPNDFKNNSNYTIEKPIPLQDVNTITIELRSEPDSFLSLEISQQRLSANLTCTPDKIYAGQEANVIMDLLQRR